MSLVQDYLKHGWLLTPVPRLCKGPNIYGWNKRENALQHAAILPPSYGIGLMHAYSGTMALDIDDWERTKAHGIDLDGLYARPDAVTILSGREGRGKLLYRMPFGLVLPSKQVKEQVFNPATGKSASQVIYEFRCGTLDGLTVQDVLPPSIHPDTGQPYAWGGAGHWTRVPLIPDELLVIWREMLKDTPPAPVDGVDASWDEIKDALAAVDPDCSRDDWVHIGMALKWTGEASFNVDQAYAIWFEWSAKGVKFPGEREIGKQWLSFKNTKNNLVTLGTLYHIARQHGWVRPVPDVSSLFSSDAATVAPADILATLRPQPPTVDLSLWPPVLTRRAQEVSDTVGCDPIVPLWAGLGAMCAVIDARTRLELMPGFQVPPVLWLMTLGDPGDRKSPGSRPMLAPLKAIEAGDKQRFAKDVQAWEYKAAQFAASKTARMKFAQSADSLMADDKDIPALLPEPEEPVALRFTVGDVTSQKLVRLAAKRPRGLLAYYDEMNSWVTKLCNPMSGEDRSAWVVAFESESYQLDRMGDGETYCENYALSIYGNMQPKVLEDNFQRLAADGLLQRFLPAIPIHDKTRIGNPNTNNESSEAWENALRLSYAMPPTTYRLSSEGYEVFRSFQVWFEQRVKSERLINSSNEFLTAFSKLTGLAGRLILMFHAMESPFAPTVSADVVKRVVHIIREYVVPAYRHVFDGSGSASVFDQWVMEYVIQFADQSMLTAAEIKRAARRQFDRAGLKQPWAQAEWVASAMHVLEKMGWVKRVDDGAQEYKGVMEWMINPYLKDMFREYREAVVKAKIEKNQHRLDIAGIEHYDATQIIHGPK